MSSVKLGSPATFLLRMLLAKFVKVSNATSYIKNLMMMTLEQKLEQDLCTATSIKVSLVCPLGKCRIIYPCRATTCTHIQCFDAMQFFMLSELKRTLTYSCPICQKSVKFEDLIMDPFFRSVILSLSDDTDVKEIKLRSDGSWEPVITGDNFSDYFGSEPLSKREKTVTNGTQTGYNSFFEGLKDIEGGKNLSPLEKFRQMRGPGVEVKNRASADQIEVIDLTIDDDDDVIYVE